MKDRRKNTLVKADFSSDLEYHLFRFATVESIEDLILENLHREGLLNRATVARYREGCKTKIEALYKVRGLMCKVLSGRELTISKPKFDSLDVTFRKVGKMLVMQCECIDHIMGLEDLPEPEEYLRYWDDYSAVTIEKGEK